MTAIIIVVAIIIAVSLLKETVTGKVVLSAAVVGMGCLILSWITELGLFGVLATVCAVVAIIAIIIRVVMFILGI